MGRFLVSGSESMPGVAPGVQRGVSEGPALTAHGGQNTIR